MVLVFIRSPVSYKDKNVVARDSYWGAGKPRFEQIQNSPVAGCESVEVYTHTGGAHCCTNMLVATICSNRYFLYDLSGGNFAEDFITDVNGDGSKELNLPLQRFAYYDADKEHGLCYACSPALLERFARWTTEGWVAAKSLANSSLLTKNTFQTS